jgi:hypothetical protein
MLYGGLSSELMVQYDRATLWRIPPSRAIDALFSFDLRFFLEALTESVFASAGITGNFTVDVFTPQGDYAAGSVEMARHYRARLQQQAMATPDADVLEQPSGAEMLLKRFFVIARSHNAVVVGTLPTTFDDHPHDPAAIARIASLYRDNGAHFLVLPNQDQYPRSCFLDSHYHLATLCQIEHSTKIGRMLGAFLSDPGAADLFYAPRGPPTTPPASPPARSAR